MTKRDIRVKAEKDFRRNYVAVIAERDALLEEVKRLRAELEQMVAERKQELYLFHNGKDIYDDRP